MRRAKLRRVDIQVSIFTACTVIISCLFIYAFGYAITYNDMIHSLTERVYAIYNYLEEELDKSTFTTINSKEDMSKPEYRAMKELFYNLKRSTGVQYLYTAKRNEKDEFIYVIDGLSETTGDFRYPGDLIEEEIVEKLNRALLGEAVFPKEIVHTTWGDIFITYLPIHDDSGAVVGAIGIEFVAEHQYKTYHDFRVLTPVIIITTCLFSAMFALIYFRRISNPNYQDLANTDYLTKLKSRNAYEIDTHNMCAMKTTFQMGIILADLNGLKIVNDTLGHEMGDLYIKLFADALWAAAADQGILYRVGGDEFVVLIEKATDEILNAYIKRIQKNYAEGTKDKFKNASCSFGYAICRGNEMSDYEKAYAQADAAMYKNKKKYRDTLKK